MSQLERDLHNSLTRREPPEGFADRVIARAYASEKRPKVYRWAAVAAMVVVLIGGIAFYRQQRQRAEAAQAKEELLFALRLTGSKLERVQERFSALQERSIQLSQPE